MDYQGTDTKSYERWEDAQIEADEHSAFCDYQYAGDLEKVRTYFETGKALGIAPAFSQEFVTEFFIVREEDCEWFYAEVARICREVAA